MSSKDYSHEGSLQRSSLQRSTTAGNAENPNLSAVKRTDTSTSLPCTTSQNKRLHDMLHIHRHHNDHSRTVDDSSTKLSRTQTSKDEYTPNSPHPSGSPMKAASALLHGIKSKTSNIYGLGHNRSTSAIERIASKTPGLRSSPFASTSGSRHESDINVDSSGNEVSNTIQQRVRPITVHDVLRERQHNEIRSEEVQEVYMTIKNKARDAEGRLEDVFGELQAKAKILRENIGELQVLVREATSLKRDFTAESGKIEEDFEQKIKAFEGLVEHKNKIEECERKIHEGKQRAKAASERLETARLTVEDWEKREEEWQRKMSKRLRLGWISALILVVCIAIVLGTRKWLLVKHESPVDIDALRRLLDNAALPSIAIEDLHEILSSRIQQLSSSILPAPTVSLGQEKRLKMLDEL